MKDDKKHSIDELLLKHLTNIATNKERAEFEKWLSGNVENREYFNKFKSVWEISANVKSYEQIDTESSLINVKSRIDFKSKPRTNIKPLWLAMRVAAILVLFFGLYLIFSNKIISPKGIAMIKVESANEIKELILPDGTVVTLNVASKIEYPENFKGNERRVNFMGEAYFKVAANKAKPFIIETNKSETKVVGTAFNLRALPNEKAESIIVTEGIVEFSGKTDETKTAVKLKKGDKAVLDTELKKAENTNPNFMAWKTSILVFDNENLNDALQVLSTFYHVKFEIKDNVLKAYTLNGRYEKLSIEEFIEVLEMTLNIKVDKQDKTYWLKSK